MKLILQAIKALFRKVENAIEKVKESIEGVRGEIPQNLDDLLNGEKISGDRIEDMYHSTWFDFSAEVETVEYKSIYLAENIGEIFGNADVWEGKTFQIIFDGTSYEIAFEWKDDQGGFGDHRFYEQGTAEGFECKYPFYLYRKNSGADYMWHLATLTGGLHTIEVKKVAEEITPIDEKYLPDGIGGSDAYHIVSNTYTGEVSIADGTYDALKDALENCKYVNFVCVIGNTNPDSGKVLNSYLPNSLRLDADNVVRGYCNNSSYAFYINPDNTGSLYYDD